MKAAADGASRQRAGQGALGVSLLISALKACKHAP